MPTIKKILTILLFLVCIIPSTSFASDHLHQLVEPFYTKILSRSSGANVQETAKAILAPDWKSIGDYSGKIKSRSEFVAQFQAMTHLIPDLNWQIEEVIVAGNKVVVRGRGTGTPVDTFLGLAPQGRSFDILTIDIHTVDNNKIVKTYHLENWLGAIAQLK